jgi:hypothetical protein
MFSLSACPYAHELRGDRVMSNYDRLIDLVVAERLKVEEAFSRYAGWNFNGRVWWDRERSAWICEVWVLGEPNGVVEGTTLTEIMDLVCERWGAD